MMSSNAPPKLQLALLVHADCQLELRFLEPFSEIFKEQFSVLPIQPITSESSLTKTHLSHHISTICKSSYYHSRQIRQLLSSLDINSAIILANSLVSSNLDYCNSLYHALSLDRLQKVQNSLARVVDPSVRRHHQITPGPLLLKNYIGFQFISEFISKLLL